MCIVVSIACSRACSDTMHLSHASRRSNRGQRRPAFTRGDTSMFKANYPATQARFQQKQLQEKEQKLLQLYDQQQQRAYQVVQRSSAGSNSSNHSSTTVRAATTMTTTTSTSQGGKVSGNAGNRFTALLENQPSCRALIHFQIDSKSTNAIFFFIPFAQRWNFSKLRVQAISRTFLISRLKSRSSVDCRTGEANVRRETADYREGNRQELPAGTTREQAAKASEYEWRGDAEER